MSSANLVVLPKTLVDGIDFPNATDSNANWEKCNDKVYASPTAPTTPYFSQFWAKSDEPEGSPIMLRMWTGTKWMAIQLMEVE